MFDDPKKELRELENQLLAAEEEHKTAELDDEEFQELYNEILEEFGPKSPSGEPVPVPEPPIRNFANGYGGVVRTPPLPAGDAILADDEPLPTEKGSNRGLVFLICLEILAVAGLAAYWILNYL